MKKMLATIGLLMTIPVLTLAHEPADKEDSRGTAYFGLISDEAVGMVSIKSNSGFQETADRLEMLINDNQAITLMARVDHAQNAETVNMQLPPTTLFIFGNPNLGTPLMQSERTVAIDLPQKMLVWEDDEGQTWVGYNLPWYLKWRHGIADMTETFWRIERALSDLAAQATGNSG